ncbi:hypothetical protein ABEF93_000134 [Exophiala dermatitidis]
MVVPPFHDPVNYEQCKELIGLKLTPPQIASLSSVGVKYLKDSSGDAVAFTELVFSLHDQITALNGADKLTSMAL